MDTDQPTTPRIRLPICVCPITRYEPRTVGTRTVWRIHHQPHCELGHYVDEQTDETTR